MDPLEEFLIHAHLLQGAVGEAELGFATDHAYVSGLAVNHLLQNHGIVLVAPGYYDQIAIPVKGELGTYHLKVIHHHLVGVGEPLLTGVLGPVIDDHHTESHHCGHLGHEVGDMACPEEIGGGHNGNGLYKYLGRIELEYPRPSQIDANYFSDLEEIVMIALQKDKNLRYPDALAMQQDLEEFVRNHKLKVSTIELGKFMEDLFREKIQQEKEALKEGKKLADIIAAKEASDFSFEEFLDLSSLPSSGGATSKSMAIDASVSGILAPAQVQRKSQSTFLIGSLALLVILLAAAGGFLGYKVWKSAQEEALKIGQVTIKTDPPGAAVYLDGDRVPGETPLTIGRLMPGVRYGLNVKMTGYEAVVREVGVTEKAPHLEVNLKLTPIKAAGMGVLKIETNQKEAVFFLDGKRVEGRGSLTWDGIKPEIPHSLLVQAPDCLDYKERFILQPGEIKEMKIHLEPRPVGADEFVLVVTTDPDGATVSVDGKNLDGVTPGRWRLPWKKALTLGISRDKFKRVERVINPPQGKEMQISEKMEKRQVASGSGESGVGSASASSETGALYLDSEPWANVTITGVGKFQTPIANLKVPMGLLRVTLENPAAGLKKTITIRIEPGKTVRKKVNLKE